MTHDALLLLAGFAVVSLFTPGPNNLMLMASGANYGLQRTIPHMAGVVFGFSAMIALTGAGMGVVFERFPLVAVVLKGVSVAYLAWLAWKIAHAAAPGEGGAEGRPLTFWEAAAFQWVNPKSWAIAMSVITVYVAEADMAVLAAVALIFTVVGLFSTSTWAALGTRIRLVLTNPVRLRAFNWIMAGLLMASVVPVLAG